MESIIASTVGPSHVLGGFAQPLSFVILMIAIALILTGIWRLVLSADDLWEGYKLALSARGLKPERTDAWERNARSSARMALGLGAVILLFAVWMSGVAASYTVSKKMSGASIDGRRLTESEWEACGKDPLRCAEMYGNKGRR